MKKISGKICVMDLNDFFLNSMPNSRSKKAYVQVFDYEYITFKSSVNMLERMYIVESIYKGVVEPPYKNPLGKMPTILVTAVKL